MIQTSRVESCVQVACAGWRGCDRTVAQVCVVCIATDQGNTRSFTRNINGSRCNVATVPDKVWIARCEHGFKFERVHTSETFSHAVPQKCLLRSTWAQEMIPDPTCERPWAQPSAQPFWVLQPLHFAALDCGSCGEFKSRVDTNSWNLDIVARLMTISVMVSHTNGLLLRAPWSRSAEPRGNGALETGDLERPHGPRGVPGTVRITSPWASDTVHNATRIRKFVDTLQRIMRSI
jgi:hypothetical protein